MLLLFIFDLNSISPSRDHFSMKNEERNQTIQKCVLELLLFHTIKVKLKLAGQFLQKSTAGHGLNFIKSKTKHHFKKPTFYDVLIYWLSLDIRRLKKAHAMFLNLKASRLLW